jgi:hypothetical protein
MLRQCAWLLALGEREREAQSIPVPWTRPSGLRSPGSATKTGCGPHVQLADIDPAGIKAS